MSFVSIIIIFVNNNNTLVLLKFRVAKAVYISSYFNVSGRFSKVDPEFLFFFNEIRSRVIKMN